MYISIINNKMLICNAAFLLLNSCLFCADTGKSCAIYVWLQAWNHIFSVCVVCRERARISLCGSSRGIECQYVVYCMCVGVFYSSLYIEDASQSKFYWTPRATEGLREPKPSIRAGHIPHMQTNELEHSPPTGSTTLQRQIRCCVRTVEGVPYNKLEIRKPSCGVKAKGQANIRTHGWVNRFWENKRRPRQTVKTLHLLWSVWCWRQCRGDPSKGL